jgi:glycerol-3-phosphate dehydrogenase
MLNAIEGAGRAALAAENERVHVFTHLSHVYRQGCSVYSTFVYRLAGDPDADLERWRRLKTAVSQAIVAGGGTISHQHGVGVDHAPYLAAEKGELGMALLRAAARELDPDAMMNPGKLWPACSRGRRAERRPADRRGGITGAAVLHAASRRGVRALLVERDDFASGTSSWSSKLVHGGMRYLKSGQWRMTLESVRERERLLRERPGLVEPQPFVMPIQAGSRPGPLALAAAFWIADRMAGQRTARRIAPDEARALEPGLGGERLVAAIAYRDGVVDDARLVLRLIFDAVANGARALNHVEATLVESAGRVTGARLVDRLDGSEAEVSAAVTVHAGGVWAGAAPGAPTLRPLRGSHLVFPRAALPLRHGLAWLHPRDRRPVFAHVWEGAVLVGTTDVDHPVAEVPATISPAEADYLVEALRLPFPALRIGAAQALSSFAGLRAIVVPPGEAHLPPSAMGRDSALWTRAGLVGITGGKLTTHRATAAEVLREVERQGCARRARAGAAAAARGGDPPRRAARQRRRGVGRRAPGRRAHAARRHAVQPRRAALVAARRAGAPSRRPADAPDPARPRRGGRRRVDPGAARGAVPRSARLGRGALARRGVAPPGKLGGATRAARRESAAMSAPCRSRALIPERVARRGVS